MKNIIIVLLILLPFALTSGIAPTHHEKEQSTRGDILKQIKNKKVSTFFNRIWEDALFVSQEYKIPIALVLAQAAQETGFGTSKNCRENNNFFGVRRCKQYESYSCKFESFVDYASNVLGADCYANCTNLNDYFTALECCGYASDKNYIKSLKKIIEKHKLYLL
jgi:flagellum-specific peptidoglycan hydrolase FlgJ